MKLIKICIIWLMCITSFICFLLLKISFSEISHIEQQALYISHLVSLVLALVSFGGLFKESDTKDTVEENNDNSDYSE